MALLERFPIQVHSGRPGQALIPYLPSTPVGSPIHLKLVVASLVRRAPGPADRGATCPLEPQWTRFYPALFLPQPPMTRPAPWPSGFPCALDH